MAQAPGSTPFPESRCHACAACRYVRTQSSVFVLCGARPDKYPRQPVVQCPAFRPVEDEPMGGDGDDP